MSAATTSPPTIDRIFSYGSLIWQPPAHIASVEVVYAQGGPDGWVRRFAILDKSWSGTPERPGLTVTLVPASSWDTSLDGSAPAEKVFGAILTVEPGYEAEVRAYLDEREVDCYGYELREIDLYRIDGTKVDGRVPVYIYPAGRAPNWVGALPIGEIASRILDAEHPVRGLSYALAAALRLNQLGDERDPYLDDLADEITAQSISYIAR